MNQGKASLVCNQTEMGSIPMTSTNKEKGIVVLLPKPESPKHPKHLDGIDVSTLLEVTYWNIAQLVSASP